MTENHKRSYPLVRDDTDDDEVDDEQFKQLWGNLVTIQATNYHDPKDEKVYRVKIPEAWAHYDLRPKWISKGVVFLNSHDPSFYEQTLPAPRFRVWVLIKKTKVDTDETGYVKKRLIEEGLRQNVQVRLVSPNKFDLSISKVGAKSVVYFGKRLHVPHCIVTRLGAASDYFGLSVLRQLSALGVPILNSADGLAISRDKLYTAQVLATNGIPTPKTVLSMYPFDAKFIAKELGFPLIVKKVAGARGEAVWRVKSGEELQVLVDELLERDRALRDADTVAREEADALEADALAKKAGEDESSSDIPEQSRHWISEYTQDRRPSAVALATAVDIESLQKIAAAASGEDSVAPAAAATASDTSGEKSGETPQPQIIKQKESQQHKFLTDPFIFQEFVAFTRGRDLRVMVVKGKVLGAMMRTAAAGGFKANVHQGGSVKNVEVGPALREIAVETARLCRLDIAGVDLMMSEKGYVVCEVNSSPGFEGLENATKTNVARDMLDQVVITCQEHQHDEARQRRAIKKFPLQEEHK